MTHKTPTDPRSKANLDHFAAHSQNPFPRSNVRITKVAN